jgi:multidrug resistance efflux pump
MDKDTPQESQEENAAAETDAVEPSQDPVRRATFVLLAISLVLLAWYLRADRVTPYTSQARVNALVVPVASEVSGTLTDVFVRNNEQVAAGQKLFQIDIRRSELAVNNAEASLVEARRTVAAADANIAAAKATVSSAEASVVRARQDSVRMNNIWQEDPGAISVRRLQSAEATFAVAVSELAAARASLDKAIQDKGAEGDANSRIQQAQAALDQARLNLDRSTVRAPEAGVVTGVRLDKGNFAAAGAPQLTFIGSRNIWLQAEFTENNLGNIDAGDKVAIVFDVLPGRVIKGSVREVGFGVAVDSASLGSLPTIENDPDWLRESQRYSVLIDFELPNEEVAQIRIGSQASAIVYTGEHWLSNMLASLIIRLISILTYAY